VVPKQPNHNDCGIYVIKYIELWDGSIKGDGEYEMPMYDEVTLSNFRKEILSGWVLHQDNAKRDEVLKGMELHQGYTVVGIQVDEPSTGGIAKRVKNDNRKRGPAAAIKTPYTGGRMSKRKK
ncbi:hypothetical protein PIB30_111743, partial [Stylosanthes scabra]|nr:hypothetical protein [Stylosanthes scabra]